MSSVSISTRTIGRAAIVLGAIALGYFVTAFSLSLAAAGANPAVALRLFPANAEAGAKAAELLIEPQADRTDWAKVRQLASDSLQRAPTSPRAVRVLALAELAKGNQRGADALMQLSRTLSRRDFPTTLYLIERAVAADQPRQALVNYDLALRTAPASYDTLFPILANALEDENLFPDFDRLAAKDPPWLAGFAASATYLPPPITNLARLLMRHPKSSAARSPELRALVVARLVRDGEFDRAFSYYTSLGRPGRDRNVLVRDEQFTGTSFLPPFEWAFVSEEEFGGEPAPGGGLRFYSSAGSGGNVASQLLMLAPGRYKLDSSAVIPSPAGAGAVQWQVACATGSNRQMASTRLRPSAGDRSAGAGTFDVPQSDCRAQTLTLVVSADANSDGFEGKVSRISIRRAEDRS